MTAPRHCRTRQRLHQGRHAQHRHRPPLACGGDVHVLVAGEGAAAAAAAAAQIAGVAKVLHADGASLKDGLAENLAAQVLAIAAATATSCSRHRQRQERRPARGRQARRGADQRHHQGGGRRHLRAPDLRGNAIATVQSADAVKVITVRGTGFDAAAAASGGSAAVESVAAVQDSGKSSFVGREVTKSDRP